MSARSAPVGQKRVRGDLCMFLADPYLAALENRHTKKKVVECASVEWRSLEIHTHTLSHRAW